MYRCLQPLVLALALVAPWILSGCSPSAPPPASPALTQPAAIESPAAAEKAYAEPLRRYHGYVLEQIGRLLIDTAAFADAVVAGDIERAAYLYAPSRQGWERIEPIAGLYPDLDGRIDARADDFKAAEQDPGFTGWHRLEYAIFRQRDLDGMTPIARQLLDDTRQLRQDVDALTLNASDVVAGAAELIEEIAATKVSGEENRYSGTDLWDIQANLEGSRTIVDLFRGDIAAADSVLLDEIDGHFALIQRQLEHYRDGEGWRHYDEVDAADRNELKGATAALAEALSKLRGTLGLD